MAHLAIPDGDIPSVKPEFALAFDGFWPVGPPLIEVGPRLTVAFITQGSDLKADEGPATDSPIIVLGTYGETPSADPAEPAAADTFLEAGDEPIED